MTVVCHAANSIGKKRLNSRERDILNAEIGDIEPRIVVRSDTRIDTGGWWSRTPLWVCVTEQDVVVLAATRRSYLQRFPIKSCRDSHYCHVTGELVIEAGEDLRFRRLAMSPTNALRVLESLDWRGSASTPTEATMVSMAEKQVVDNRL